MSRRCGSGFDDRREKSIVVFFRRPFEADNDVNERPAVLAGNVEQES